VNQGGTADNFIYSSLTELFGFVRDFSFFKGKEKFGFGTIVSMVITGLLIDLVLWTKLLPVPSHFVPGVLMLLAGLFIIASGSYFYMKTAFGAGPRDNLMVVLNRITKLPIV